MPDETRQYGESWKKRFALLDQLVEANKWYPDRQAMKEAPSGELWRVNFNILAFLFTVIYYYSKGMWAKASLMLTVYLLLNIVPVADKVSPFALGAVCMGLANIDYWHKERRGERMWPIFPPWFGSVQFAVLGPIVSCLLLLIALSGVPIIGGGAPDRGDGDTVEAALNAAPWAVPAERMKAGSEHRVRSPSD